MNGNNSTNIVTLVITFFMSNKEMAKDRKKLITIVLECPNATAAIC